MINTLESAKKNKKYGLLLDPVEIRIPKMKMAKLNINWRILPFQINEPFLFKALSFGKR